MKRLIMYGMCAALCASWVGSANADEAPNGYADAMSAPVLTGHGGCLITPRWTPERAVETFESAPEFVEECHPDLVPEVIVEVPVAPAMTQDRATFAADAFFAFDSASLKPEAMDSLQALVRDMSTASTINSLGVVGHTDSTGPADYNQGLSERRANSVRDALTQLGVNPALIEARGDGENNPRASNDTREGRAENRRVDINVEGIKESMSQ
jgi:OOP family OmpA-OmpF porin